jgi:nucleotide-binding universal stress UspA family protein
MHILHAVKVADRFDGHYTLSDLTRGDVVRRTMASADEHLAQLELGPVPEGIRVTREAKLGVPARTLAESAADLGADLIVVASHGRTGLKRFVLGSVANALIRVAHCPVLIVGEGREGLQGFEHVTAAIDLSKISPRVVSHAARFASAYRGRVSMLSIHELPLLAPRGEDLLPGYFTATDIAELHSETEGRMREIGRRLELDPLRYDVRSESAEDVTAAIVEGLGARGADLVVIGTSGHSAWQRAILGSVATKVVAEAPCPVLVVPHDVP